MKPLLLSLLVGLVVTGCAPEYPTPTTPAATLTQGYPCSESHVKPPVCNGVILR